MKPLDILFVDDDRDLADAIDEALEMVGHRVTVAHCGAEAIEEYRKRRYDLTFMDVKLPDINGVEAFLTIREMDPTARVAMMAAYRIDQLLAQATQKGAVNILLKPFSMEDILQVIEEIRPRGLLLVADDDPDFAESTEQLLSDRGFEVLIARNGVEAVEKVVNRNPDLLLLDLRLPVMHGLEVYLELKRRKRLLPTIIFTGYRREELNAIETLKSLSVTGCLFKPFEPEILLQAIDKVESHWGPAHES